MRDMILVLSFDADFGNSVARRLRGEHVYCKLVPRDITLEQVKRENPSGLILAGGVTSRGERRRDMESMDPRLLQADLPVLALGSAARTLCEAEGGTRLDDVIEKRAVSVTYRDSPLFSKVEVGERWLEHSHNLALPEGFASIAEADGCVMGFAHNEKPLYGLQFQVEKNDPDGMAILLNFVLGICKCTAWWEENAFAERAKEELQRVIGNGQAVCAVTGGLDSTVCALLAQRAVGDKVHCVLVDTGLMRQGEPEWVTTQLTELSLRVRYVDARARMAEALTGVVNAAQKCDIVQQVIAEELESEAQRIGEVTVLLRGTNYSDVAQAALQGSAAVREERQGRLTVVEPLLELFREEVYRVGELLELPAQLLQRQPFPDGGLAVRVFGEATPERVRTLRAADAILENEIEKAGLTRKLWKYFAVLAQMPEGESAGQVVLLRAVQHSDVTSTPARLPYDLLERVVERIQREVQDIARVVYDVTMSVHVHNEM